MQFIKKKTLTLEDSSMDVERDELDGSDELDGERERDRLREHGKKVKSWTDLNEESKSQLNETKTQIWMLEFTLSLIPFLTIRQTQVWFVSSIHFVSFLKANTTTKWNNQFCMINTSSESNNKQSSRERDNTLKLLQVKGKLLQWLTMAVCVRFEDVVLQWMRKGRVRASEKERERERGKGKEWKVRIYCQRDIKIKN